MKRLTLLRHAKSDWLDRSLRDFDRPLNARGMRGAKAMGLYAAEKKMVFDAVVDVAMTLPWTRDPFDRLIAAA